MKSRIFTGRDMAGILIGFFAVVIAVNILMATLASRTFGGLVVENSYVASQKFNGWLAQARSEKALGWTLAAMRGSDGHVAVRLAKDGGMIGGAQLTGRVRHPLGQVPERTLSFTPRADAGYESRETLPAGRWIIHVEARANGKVLRQIVDLQ